MINNVRTATLVRDNIFETDRIDSPFVCGFIKPKIYVPINLPEQELSYILAHEQTHIRRLDYLVKPFAFLVLIIHWFNPIMWLSFALMSKDMEMSCDESVIRRMGSDRKASYSNSLLSLAVKRSGLLVGSPLAFGESHHYLLARFEIHSNNNDLRGHIMMAISKDMLGDRNSVTDESLSPQEWYAQLSSSEENKVVRF